MSATLKICFVLKCRFKINYGLKAICLSSQKILIQQFKKRCDKHGFNICTLKIRDKINMKKKKNPPKFSLTREKRQKVHIQQR